jgi:hypothetical protein
LCVEVDDNGNESFTWCSGSQNDNIGCATEVEMTLNFPSMPWVAKIGTTNDCGDPDCGQGSLDHCCTGGNGTAMGGSIPLYKQPNENKWANRDDQQLSPLEERPDPANQQPSEQYTFLGYLDGQYRFGSCQHTCYPDNCDANPMDGCQKCRTDWNSYPAECIPCSSQHGWSCPCCCGSRWMSCWGQAEVWQDAQGQCPLPTADHGSVCWQVRISVTLMSTGCLDPYGGEGCNCSTVQLGCLPDTQNFPDSTRHIWSRSTGLSLYYKIQVPECGCPNGISSGDAWEVSSSQGIPDETCKGTCGCKRWASWFGGIVDYDDLISGASWSIA